MIYNPSMFWVVKDEFGKVLEHETYNVQQIVVDFSKN